MIKIVIIDDHAIVGEGTKSILSKELDFEVEFKGSSVNFNKVITDKDYDVYLIDLHMPEFNGLQLTKKILQHHLKAKIIIFTAHDISSHFNHFMNVGVAGFINKSCSSEELVRTIRCAMNNQVIIPLELLSQLRMTEGKVMIDNGQEIQLTEKEELILQKVIDGLSNDLIADELFISRRSVERCLTGLFKKVNVTSRSELIVKAKQLGLVSEFSV